MLANPSRKFFSSIRKKSRSRWIFWQLLSRPCVSRSRTKDAEKILSFSLPRNFLKNHPGSSRDLVEKFSLNRPGRIVRVSTRKVFTRETAVVRRVRESPTRLKRNVREWTNDRGARPVFFFLARQKFSRIKKKKTKQQNMTTFLNSLRSLSRYETLVNPDSSCGILSRRSWTLVKRGRGGGRVISARETGNARCARERDGWLKCYVESRVLVTTVWITIYLSRSYFRECEKDADTRERDDKGQQVFRWRERTGKKIQKFTSIT